MVPVSTSGILVWGAFAPSCFGEGAAPNRCALVTAARSSACVGLGARTAGAAAPRLPELARSVTMKAPCTPRPSASAQVARRGPSFSSSARQRSCTGKLSSQEVAFIDLAQANYHGPSHSEEEVRHATARAIIRGSRLCSQAIVSAGVTTPHSGRLVLPFRDPYKDVHARSASGAPRQRRPRRRGETGGQAAAPVPRGAAER